MLRVRCSQDLWAGVLFFAIGFIMLVGAADLAQGTAMRMGPGYAPRLLCGLLILIGAILVFRGIAIEGPDTGQWGLRPAVFVLGSMIAFALGVERLGLFLTIFIVVCLASLAISGVRPVGTFVAATCIAAGSCALFVYGLKLLIPVWPQL